MSRLAPDRAAAMAEGVVESRAQRDRVEEITDLFVRTLGKKLGYGHPLSERTGTEVIFTWTPEAEACLSDIPEFCRDLTRWRVEWTAHKLGLGTSSTSSGAASPTPSRNATARRYPHHHAGRDGARGPGQSLAQLPAGSARWRVRLRVTLCPCA